MSVSSPSARYQAHLRTPSPDPDAGLRGLSHYERKLPKWRYHLRQQLIPIVRSETPLLAHLQEKFRTPFLDSYFAMTANLGTHTFFMTALPICFWFGFPSAGMALVHMLAAGVYLSGYVKDLVCLPRPLSPPLQRITMSGSAALEYGFPSTHTTNAISVAVFCLYELWVAQESYSTATYALLVSLCLCYAISISIGRMYCGMHGFSDVIFGAALGTGIAAVRICYGDSFDQWTISSDWTRPAITLVVMLLSVRFHPEPADNCPCFDDSVAFVGVVMGCSVGTWHYAHLITHSATPDIPLKGMYIFTNHDVVKAPLRLVGGIVTVFLWRAIMKPLLLTVLPPIFRFVAEWGFHFPRRYFLQSREYNAVPTLRQDDKVIPAASAIPSMLSDIRRRKRTISVGPQSEADARELIANREHRKREGRKSSSLNPLPDKSTWPSKPSMLATADPAVLTPADTPPATSYLSVTPEVSVGLSATPVEVRPQQRPLTPPGSDSGRDDDKNDQQLLAAVEKPRVRYDVEVITKLVVYAGIAWLAVEGNPIIFNVIGIA